MKISSNVNVVILAGGLGTRLKPIVNDRPKVMALINGRPFLTYLLDQISNAGLMDVILCVGYMGKYVESEMGLSYKNLSLRYSYEYEPLGTGGALRNAHDLMNTDTILVMNGDSYCRYNLEEYGAFHKQKHAMASLLLTFVDDTRRYGCVKVDEHNYVLAFEEKRSSEEPGWINAGVYIIDRDIISEIPHRRFVSLEKEIFPSLIGREFYGFMSDGYFLDIGTPKDFATAEMYFKSAKFFHERG